MANAMTKTNTRFASSPFAALMAVKPHLAVRPASPASAVAGPKKQDMTTILTKVVNHLVDRESLPVRQADAAVVQLLDAFKKVAGGMPHNAQVVIAALGHPVAQDILAAAKAEVKAEVTAQAARQAAAAAAKKAADAAAAKAAAFSPPPTANCPGLGKETEEHLHALLLKAVKSDKETEVDAALRHIISVCTRKGQDFFVTAFRDRTQVKAMLLARRAVLGVRRFGLYWSENGLDDSVLLPEATPAKAIPAKQAPPVPVPAKQELDPSWFDEDGRPIVNYRLVEEQQAYLDSLLEPAMDALMATGSYEMLEHAVGLVMQVCRAYGQDFFVTRFTNRTEQSGKLVGCLRCRKDRRFGFFWSRGGVATMRREPAKVQDPEAARTRAAVEARRAANRQARLEKQPAKGKNGGGGDKGGPKKGKGKK